MYEGSDGNRFELERGEGIFVTSRRATNPALRMLDQANLAHGGRSMFSSSSRYGQDGGEMTQGTNNANMVSMIESAIAAQRPPVVQVESILGGIIADQNARKVGMI